MNPFVYAPRAVDFHGTITAGDHRLKVYSLRSERFADASLPAADTIQRIFTAALPAPVLEADHKVGFGILHWANDGLYALVSTWYDANMLRLMVFLCDDLSKSEPVLTPLNHLNIITCVWELEIYKYERDVWMREVLAKQPASLTEDLIAAYLADGMKGTV
ncbi:MAG: hypothetical protein R3D02_16610 [Hyphomicrobiales bacterium]